MSDKTLIWLEDAHDVSKVGGKALALGKMFQADFKIPNGFVLPVNAFNALTPELETALLDSFDELAARFVAVRSSAINEDGSDAAWAGQLDTFLNCSRDDLIEKVNDCLESANTDRAKSYAEQKGIAGTSVAVVVQEMIDSDVSGVAFSAHPVTGNDKQVVIEAGFGLGEAIVSGQVTPDTYVIGKQDWQQVEKHVGTQMKMLIRGNNGKNVWQEVQDPSAQKLSDEQIIKVCTVTRELEDFFKYPVDVEWAIHNGQLYILQCRPITTLT